MLAPTVAIRLENRGKNPKKTEHTCLMPASASTSAVGPGSLAGTGSCHTASWPAGRHSEQAWCFKQAGCLAGTPGRQKCNWEGLSTGSAAGMQVCCAPCCSAPLLSTNAGCQAANAGSLPSLVMTPNLFLAGCQASQANASSQHKLLGTQTLPSSVMTASSFLLGCQARPVALPGSSRFSKQVRSFTSHRQSAWSMPAEARYRPAIERA